MSVCALRTLREAETSFPLICFHVHLTFTFSIKDVSVLKVSLNFCF